MKKQHLFFFFIFLGCSLLLQAQSKWTKGATLSFGFSGERSQETEKRNTNTSTNTRETESKLMPSFGSSLWIERSFKEHLSIELGLNYGYLQHFERLYNESSLASGRVRSTYQKDKSYEAHQLYVPLQLHYFYNKKSDNFGPFLTLGGQVSYFLSVTESAEIINIGTNRNSHYLNKKKYSASKNNDLINHNPLSFFVGFGFDFGAFRFEINRTQYALKENRTRGIGADIEPCQCSSFPTHITIPSIHTTLISLKYKL